MKDETAILEAGEFTECKLTPRGSNYTYLATLSYEEQETKAVYKPQAGEMPLRDYPSGTLYLREYASFLLSQSIGWRFIPTTVIRDGPHGVGAVQLFIEAEEDQHYFTFTGQCELDLQRIAIFDVISNNGDRKAGHFLKGMDGRIWGIDHGLTFHYQHKLRTVMWDFQGQPIPQKIIRELEDFKRALDTPENSFISELQQLITGVEVEAFLRRIEAAISSGTFPVMGAGRNTPWPPI
ncbi:MAG: hypothetical protein EXR50_05290 [Dehalococcoidia bacterium]|nr:hypothetical protein [Dehalococcoidia bacterium]